MREKDYKKIAKVFKDDKTSWRTQQELNTHNRLANELANYFGSENPKFDMERFLIACGENVK